MDQFLCIKGRIIGKGEPLICVPIMERTKEGILKEAARLAELSADMIEWRVDAFEQAGDLNAIREVLDGLSPIVKNTILLYTFRSKKQGGLLDLGAEKIYDIHQVAGETKTADFVDVEFFEAKRPEKEIRTLQEMGVHVIASHHDFSETPRAEVMQMLLEQMKQSGTDVVKLAVMPRSVSDVLCLLEETNRFHGKYPYKPLITMSMGALGCISRVAGETFGSCVTFGAMEQASAPGQLPVKELAQILDTLHKSMGE